MRPNSAAADWPRIRELPTAIYAVVARLQALEQHGDALTSQIPRVRLRTRSGQWLVLHASRMSGPALPAPIAVILEIAQAVEIAPLIIQAYWTCSYEQVHRPTICQNARARSRCVWCVGSRPPRSRAS